MAQSIPAAAPRLVERITKQALARGEVPSLAEESVRAIVELLARIPYGRASSRAPEAIIEEWRGTCSGKHYLLRSLLQELGARVQLVHRVYRVRRADALARFGVAAASCVPEGGLVDVHTYARVEVAPGRWAVVDVTFEQAWDGAADMRVAAGEGEDFPVAEDADAQQLKEALIASACDPVVREPFIRALSLLDAPARNSPTRSG